MKIRKAKLENLDEIMNIYAYAREFMASTGNSHQWGDRKHPARELIEQHIQNEVFYKVYEDDEILGVFALVFGVDPTYIQIEGSWLNEEPYVTVHALAAKKGAKGIFDAVISFAKAKSKNIRIDTHQDNKIMQHLCLKHGFKYCGIIHCFEGEGSERLAYQFVDKDFVIPKKKLYIVDYDGTIISSMEMWNTMCSTFLKDHGFELKEDVDRLAITQTNRETATYMVKNYFPELTIDEMEEKMNAYVANHYAKQKLKENALNMLKEMKKNGKVVIFSATAMPLLELSIDTLGLRPYIDQMYSASQLGVTKKDGSGFLKILEFENIEKEDSLVVEDAIHAILGAKMVGLEVLCIQDSANQSTLFQVYKNSDYYLR